jgi:hypothetical protein
MPEREELEQLPPGLGQPTTLARLALLWPRMDEISQDSLRDYFARLTNSWVTYSPTMTPEQKQELMRNVHAELTRRANALELMYPADESSPSGPTAA